MADFLAISGNMEDRAIEYVDHLHEHFVSPVRIVNGRYAAPTAPGFSSQMHDQSVNDYEFPTGRVWRQLIDHPPPVVGSIRAGDH
jgi:L-fuconate dehydratase